MVNKTKKSGYGNIQADNSTALTNSKIEESMKQYGTYTATSDANHEYPPKNSSADMSAQTSSSASSARNMTAGVQTVDTTEADSAVVAGAQASVQTPRKKASQEEANSTLTAQYDANGRP